MSSCVVEFSIEMRARFTKLSYQRVVQIFLLDAFFQCSVDARMQLRGALGRHVKAFIHSI